MMRRPPGAPRTDTLVPYTSRWRYCRRSSRAPPNRRAARWRRGRAGRSLDAPAAGAGPAARSDARAELRLDHRGDAELAQRRDRIGGAGIGHLAEIVGRARSEDIVAELRLAHRGHELAQDHRFEGFGDRKSTRLNSSH